MDDIDRRNAAYANFVIGTGLSFTPEQYLSLTKGEREAVIEMANKARK